MPTLCLELPALADGLLSSAAVTSAPSSILTFALDVARKMPDKTKAAPPCQHRAALAALARSRRYGNNNSGPWQLSLPSRAKGTWTAVTITVSIQYLYNYRMHSIGIELYDEPNWITTSQIM